LSNLPIIVKPIPLAFNWLLRSLTYKAKKYGDKIPPWRTPFWTKNDELQIFPHLIWKVWFVNQITKKLTNFVGNLLSISFLRRNKNWTLSNALLASRHTREFLSYCTNQSIALVCKYIARILIFSWTQIGCLLYLIVLLCRTVLTSLGLLIGGSPMLFVCNCFYSCCWNCSS